MTVAMPFPGYPYGYSPFAKEALAASRGETTPPDLKESFSIGPRSTWDATGWDPSQGFNSAPTLWPAEPPRGSRRCFAATSPRWESSLARILSLFALALDLPSDFFATAIDRHASALRALDYPALDYAPGPGQLRAGAHSDYGSLTVLLAEPGSRGLEILHPDGNWQAVPIEEGAFIVNIGDLMARWSNDRWVSTVHRCSCEGSQKRRRSIAFFHLPNWDAEIRCHRRESRSIRRSRRAPISWRSFGAPCGHDSRARGDRDRGRDDREPRGRPSPHERRRRHRGRSHPRDRGTLSPPVPRSSRRTDSILLPGLVNLHVHLGLVLPGKMAAELAGRDRSRARASDGFERAEVARGRGHHHSDPRRRATRGYRAQRRRSNGAR